MIFFALAALGLSWAVYDRVQTNSQATAGPGMGGPRGPGGMVPVEVVRPVVQRVADDIESVGTTVANESVSITPKVTDTVSRIHFRDGQVVQRGDILVELTNSAEAARLAEARASEEEARTNLQRMQRLAEDSLVSRAELDAARTRWETAEARLDGVLVSMDDRLIRAPFDGLLGFRQVSEGSLVSPNTEITTIDDISVLKLDFSVPERYMAELQPGVPVAGQSIVYRGAEFDGEVQVVGSRIDPVTRAIPVRAELANPDGLLRPGMLITIKLGLNAADSLVVPEQAIVPSQGRHYVYVVDGESIARRQEVQVGRRSAGIVEVVSGISADQMVITEGIGQVRPDMRVRVLNPGSGELDLSSSRADASAAPLTQS